MASLNRYNLILLIALNMSLCLLVHTGSIHRPSLYDEELLAMIDSNGLSNNAYDNSNHNERQGTNLYPLLLSLANDDNTFQQPINNHRDIKRSKLNLHTNLNLPRYLRSID
ncbi:unnamed protein product [Rotaria sp. Silwood1]|nr:unnamed protein product [Rotaria sp. Silwood1]CAF1542803.1 unnamed protein product [Rotaria sp. Silwood1]CAF3667404.1 unnamed protein product [Rotaria sp. Silwood1]CAF4766986.1 unnamed protein product [Rotaria sp. Silwood1]CAF4787239.1 unnamed protein product [Rotaria sp. Silwood1]